MTIAAAAETELDPVDEFLGRLRSLSGEQLTVLARASEDARATAAGDIEWWRATTTVARELRRQRRSRRAAVASMRASEAVLSATGAAELPRDDIVHAARTAGEVARALVANTHASLSATFVSCWLSAAAGTN
jgi:hypothetical protein